MIGHLLGAASAVEAVACVKAITDGWVHPNVNLDDPEDDVDLALLVGPTKERLDVKVALSNSFGFGGASHLALVPVRPRSRGERRSLRTFAVVSLRPPPAFNPRPRRLSTPPDAFQLHPDVQGTTAQCCSARTRAAAAAAARGAGVKAAARGASCGSCGGGCSDGTMNGGRPTGPTRERRGRSAIGSWRLADAAAFGVAGLIILETTTGAIVCYSTRTARAKYTLSLRLRVHADDDVLPQ